MVGHAKRKELGVVDLVNEDDKDTLGHARHRIRNYLDTRKGLKNLGILRSERTLQGDYAEWLVARLLNLHLSKSAVEKGLDARDEEGRTYQIKSRIVSDLSSRTSFDLSDPDFHFDHLVAGFFDLNLDVLGMLRIPYDVVIELGSQTASTFRLYSRGLSSLDNRVEQLFWSN